MTCRVTVLGAGAIGIFVGGKLAVAGAEVTFVGRPRLLEEITASGLRLSDLGGGDDRVAADGFRVATEPADADTADLILITVKSAQTADAAKQLTGRVRPDTVVLSLQNGIGNDTVIREALPAAVVLPGVVMFNVAHREGGRFHRGTAGGLAIADDPALDRFASLLGGVGLPLQRYPDLRPVQWAKLLLNLNNPINALSGQPLRTELAQRDFRRCLALAQAEALTAMRRARIRPARLTALPPALMVRLLTVPDAVFAWLADTVLAVDPLARSSMADDLALGRPTEIAWLSGEIVALGRIVGMSTPVNTRLVELIAAAEGGHGRSWPGSELLAELCRAATDAARKPAAGS